MKKFAYRDPIYVGCGGGISTPQSVVSAFAMGADYVLTGSVNQGASEAGTSSEVKKILAEVEPHDVIMAPAADMFEMGVKLQVLRRGTLFPMRSQRLYALYQNHGSLEEIPANERKNLEDQIFKKTLDQVWKDTEKFFQERDPSQLVKASQDPKHKMALVFRWYLGKSSLWAIQGTPERRMDYQVWVGPSMGAFNEWVRGSELQYPKHRSVVGIAKALMHSASILTRANILGASGVEIENLSQQLKPRSSEQIQNEK